MGKETGIAWCDHTFNPWWGCTKVAPECSHCYAETWSKRVGLKVWGADTERRSFGPKHWAEPYQWNNAAAAAGVRRRVFCASMADVFEERADLDLWRERLWKLIDETTNLDWLLLTKRPENIETMMPRYHANVWLGTTAGSQETANKNIPVLLEQNAVIRFVSCEPLLGPIDFRKVPITYDQRVTRQNLDWVIVGCESGPRARPMDEEWTREIRNQCREVGVPFFLKQAMRNGKLVSLPKLDGRQWAEFPKVRQ